MAGERGQATVEWVALVTLVALVLGVGAVAADASWLPGRLRCAIFARPCHQGATSARAPVVRSAALRAGVSAPAAPARQKRPLERGGHRPRHLVPGVLAPRPHRHRPLNRGGHRPHAVAAFLAGRRALGPSNSAVAAFRAPRARASSRNWIPGANFKSDMSQADATRLSRQLRDRSLQLAVSGVLLGVGGVKFFAEKVLHKIAAEILGGLGELGAIELNKLSNRVADAVSDAKPGQRICVHFGLKGPSVFGLPGAPLLGSGVDLTAWPRKGNHC